MAGTPPWFEAAFAALEAIVAGRATDDSWTAEYAELFPNAEFVVQPQAGHYPWLDDADRSVATTAAFRG
ncbi:MAG TPA: hypothetical protein VII22_00945 [Streptosporangiaceae bacterium]